ncbi:MAG: hypothetical protein U0Y68_19740 [Blastocatellia bacterium]
MTQKRKIEITVENRTMVFRRTSTRVLTSCPHCAANVLLTPDEAATIARTTTRTIFHWIETGQLHFVETEKGQTLVCPNSLPTLS